MRTLARKTSLNHSLQIGCGTMSQFKVDRLARSYERTSETDAYPLQLQQRIFSRQIFSIGSVARSPRFSSPSIGPRPSCRVRAMHDVEAIASCEDISFDASGLIWVGIAAT